MSKNNSKGGLKRGERGTLPTPELVDASWAATVASAIVNHQTELPQMAKDAEVMAKVEQAVALVATVHRLKLGDARNLDFVPDNSIHLVVTSPPYWTLKTYEEHLAQLGSIESYEGFLDQLDLCWRHCLRVLVPGGRLIVNVGDVCLSRRQNGGEHTVVPLHASIQERCRHLGFSNLAPIIWHKIANARFEAQGNGAGFLGKPYEPNAVIKNDIEFVLMLRKPGGYRSPSVETRLLSLIPGPKHKEWFQQVWTGLTGASTRGHPAPFPVELAERLIRMFSFVGDTVLDPFGGSGTTSVAARRCGRNSLCVEVIPGYHSRMVSRLHSEAAKLSSQASVIVE